MTECHESFSFQLKKFWHDRVPPLKVLKSMWTQTAARGGLEQIKDLTGTGCREIINLTVFTVN